MPPMLTNLMPADGCEWSNTFSVFPHGDRVAQVAQARVDGASGLTRELFSRFEELHGLGAKWAGKFTAPSRDAIVDALSLGLAVIDKCKPTPHALNITASRDGEVLFTLFGKGGREAELWVGAAGKAHFTYVLTHGDRTREGTLALIEFGRVAGWLAGHEIAI